MGAFVILLLGCSAVSAGVLLGLNALGVVGGGRNTVEASLEAIKAYGQAPVTAVESDDSDSFRHRVVAPFLAQALVVGRKVTAAENAERIRHKLDIAGNPPGWTVDRVVAMKVIGFIGGLLASLGLTSLLGLGFMPKLAVCVGAALIGYVGVNLWLYDAGTKRVARMQHDLPDAVDLLTISVEAGLGFDAAMAQVARNTDGPIAHEFARLLQELNIGKARGQAMRALGERTTLPELRAFANALAQADSLGIAVGKVLRVQSQEMRIKRRQLAEEKAQKVAVKILFPLMFCILPTLFIIVLGPAILNLLHALHK